MAKGTYFQAVQDDGVLYCTTDLGMAIWNVADPAQPVLLSWYVATGAFQDGQLRKAGNTVLLLKRGKVHAVDVTNPAAPTGVELDLGAATQVQCFELLDTLLYAGTGTSIVTFNVADLANPVPLDTMPIWLLAGLHRTDTMLLAITQQTVMRAGIGTGVPVLLDTIAAQGELMVMDARMTTDRLALLEGDGMSGLYQVALYDVAMAGTPALQEVVAMESWTQGLLAMDDSVLMVQGGQSWIYDISVPGGAVPAGALPGGLDSHDDAYLEDDRLYTMDGVFGFSIFQRSGPTAFSVLVEHRVGDWVHELKSSTMGFVLAEGLDSLFVLDPYAPGVGTGVRASRLYDAEDWWVYGDLLVEFRMIPPAHYELTILRIEPDGSLDFQANLIPLHNGSSERLAIWDNVLYWSGYMSTVTVTDRYNLDDPATPVFMDSTAAEYNAQWGGVLYTIWNEQGVTDLYDPESSPPEWLATQEFTLGCTGFQAGYVYQDPQRAVLHQVSNSCYAAVDFQDTASIASYGPFPITEPIGPMGDGTGVWNKILYIPGLNAQKVFLYDVCEPGYFNYLATLPLRNFPRDLAFVDSVMVVPFGGYVESYDISSVLPCLVTDVATLGEPAVVAVYPNPARDAFLVEALDMVRPVVVEVLDATGRLVRSTVQGHSSDPIRVSCADLAPGLYTVRVIGGTKAALAKVVVE